MSTFRDGFGATAKDLLQRAVSAATRNDRLGRMRGSGAPVGGRQRQADLLVRLYERARRTHGDDSVPEAPRHDGLPAADDVARVEQAALADYFAPSLFSSICADGDIARAAVGLVRSRLAAKDRRTARAFAQYLQRFDDLRPVADICLAVVAATDPMLRTVWTLLSRNDPALVLRFAPVAYFRAGFVHDPAQATRTLDQVLTGEFEMSIPPGQLLEIARSAFEQGDTARTEQVLALAEGPAGALDGRPGLRHEIAGLRRWCERLDRARHPVALADGEVPVALLSAGHPRQAMQPESISYAFDALATLSRLARLSGVRFTGDPELAAFASDLRSRVAAERRQDCPDATVRLVTADRDLTSFSPLPDRTWVLAGGDFLQPVMTRRFDLPLAPQLRPVFVSVHVADPAALSPEAIAQFRRCAPVGCRDEATALLLHAAGVSVFLSGPLTAGLDILFPGDGPGEGTCFVDVAANGDGDVATEKRTAPGAADLLSDLREAVDRAANVVAYRRVVSASVDSYAIARAAGREAEFRPPNPAGLRGFGLVDQPDEEFAQMRATLDGALDAVLPMILAGQDEEQVYARWREVCAPAVARFEADLERIPALPGSKLDVAAACETTWRSSVVVERTGRGPDGSEINIEFSLDGNLKRQLSVVLDSIVTRASRPIRAFVMCRDHGPDDYARLAEQFPTVSFVWLPTDDVDHGAIAGLISYITVATMDRLLLPDLLADVSRIIHFDLDALCLADVAELFDVDLHGCAIAARPEPQERFTGGLTSFRQQAQRMRRDPGLARDHLRRTHTRHRFDFRGFNAGIMVLDLDRMRADHFSRDFLPYAELFGFHDQQVLNAYAGADYVALDDAWNRLVRVEVPEPVKVAHWAGPIKPWGDGYVTGREWWEAAEERLAARLAASAAEAESPVRAG